MSGHIIQTATPGLRWRRVQVIDECWQLEMADPSFKAKDDDEIDGYRPIAHIWQWEWSSKTNKPWRAPLGFPKTNRDYTTRESAMRWTEKRIAGAQPSAPERSRSMDDWKAITLGFRVPESLDTPSEVLAEVKQLFIDALAEKLEAHKQGRLRMNPDRLALCEMLLTES